VRYLDQKRSVIQTPQTEWAIPTAERALILPDHDDLGLVERVVTPDVRRVSYW